MALLSANGIGRLFGHPVNGAEESSAVLLAVTLLAIQSRIRIFGPNITMDMIYLRLPSTTQAVLKLIEAMIVLFFFSTLAVASATWALQSLQVQEYRPGIVDIPIYPAKALFFVMFSSVAVQQLAYTLRLLAFQRLRRPEPPSSPVTVA